MPDEAPPSSPVKAAPSTRSLVALITAITGLVGAIAAFKKPPEEPAAKESYAVIVKAVQELTTENDEMRKDFIELRTSFEDYVKAKEGSSNVEAPPAASGQLPLLRVQVRPTPLPAATTSSTRVPLPAPVPSTSSTATPSVAVPFRMQEVVLPAVRKKAMGRSELPSYDAIERKAKM